MQHEKISPRRIKEYKGREPLAALTCYDYPMAKLLDEAGIPFLLVGDSLGMVVLGYPDTTHVTMEEMLHHTRAAARAKPKGFLVADLPHRAFDTVDLAVANARRLVDAGAEAVKAEGGTKILPQIQAMRDAGIQVVGHLGMLPQSVLEEGGYKIKGRREEERLALLADAAALDAAGVVAIVLELVTPPVAKEITHAVSCPTIGIGSGLDCDGQILVVSDLVGMFPWFTPRFVRPTLQAGRQIQEAALDWMRGLKLPSPHV